MKSSFSMGSRAELGLIAKPTLQEVARFGGRWELECLDKDGRLKWKAEAHNLVVTVGLQHILDVVFAGSTQVNPWYVGLTAGSPSPAAGDTMASHAGWTEFTTYSESVRQTYTDARTGQSVDNDASKAAFSINGSGTVGGAFLVSDSTKGGSSGTLLCAVAATEGNRSVVSGDTINAKYTFSAADDGA